jgi:hypothetical protein
MDLRLLLAVPTDAERQAVDEFVGSAVAGRNGHAPKVQVHGRVAHGGHEERGQRHLLLRALEAVQPGSAGSATARSGTSASG